MQKNFKKKENLSGKRIGRYKGTFIFALVLVSIAWPLVYAVAKSIFKIVTLSGKLIDIPKHIISQFSSFEYWWQVVVGLLILFLVLFVLAKIKYRKLKKSVKSTNKLGDARWFENWEAMLKFMVLPSSEADKYPSEGVVVSSMIVKRSKDINKALFEFQKIKESLKNFNLKKNLKEINRIKQKCSLLESKIEALESKGKDTTSIERKLSILMSTDSQKLSSKQKKKLLIPKSKELARKLVSSAFEERDSTGELITPTSSKNIDKKYEVIYFMDTKGPHSIIIGASGSNKTQGIVYPTIHSLSKSRVDHSFIINDPKGELFDTTSADLEKQGYEIKVINFLDPENTNEWNPLKPIVDIWESAIMGKKEMSEFDIEWKKKIKKAPKTKLTKLTKEYELERTKKKKELGVALMEGNVGTMLDDITKSVMPSKPGAADSMWDSNSRNVLKGYIWLMLEQFADTINGTLQNKSLAVSKEQINLPNIATMASLVSSDPTELINYYGIEKTKDILGEEESAEFKSPDMQRRESYAILAPLIINNAGDTAAGIITQFKSTMEAFGQQNVKSVVSNKGFDLGEMGKKKMAVYIIVPDHTDVYNFLGALFIKQSYTALVDVASKEPSKRLPVSVNMILDEFGNFPEIPNMAGMTSVARSRGINLNLILQSLSQINRVYSPDIRKEISSNIKTTILLSTGDLNTAEEIERKMGKYTDKEVNENISTNAGTKGVSVSSSEQEQSISLMSADQLIRLARNTGVVLLLSEGQFPTMYIPYWWNHNTKDNEPIHIEKELLESQEWDQKHRWYFSLNYKETPKKKGRKKKEKPETIDAKELENVISKMSEW